MFKYRELNQWSIDSAIAILKSPLNIVIYKHLTLHIIVATVCIVMDVSDTFILPL